MAYFNVHYYTKCVLLKVSCATLKRIMSNIKICRLGVKQEAAKCFILIALCDWCNIYRYSLPVTLVQYPDMTDMST